MSKQTVTIVVKSKPGTGGSRITAAVNDALTHLGFDVDTQYIEPFLPDESDLPEKVKINIVMEQLPRQ